MSTEQASSTPGWAVLVGINAYEDEASYPQLQSCVRDAIGLYFFLTHPSHTNLAAEHVILLLDGADQDVHATAESVAKALHVQYGLQPRAGSAAGFAQEVLAKRLAPQRAEVLAQVNLAVHYASDGELLIIFMAGHGEIFDGQFYLIPPDARRSMLADTAIPLSRVKEVLGNSRAQHKVLLLDQCFSGSTVKDVVSPGNEELKDLLLSAPGEVAIFTSCLPWELSDEDDEHGIFAKFLLEGLSGKALRARDEGVTLHDLASYVTDNVKTWETAHRAHGKTQTPRLNDAGDRLGHRIFLSGRLKPRNLFSDDLFVSCTREDLAAVKPLVERLRSEGCRLAFDESEMPARQDKGTVAARIERCRQTLVCLSDDYLRQDQTQFELANSLMVPRHHASRTVAVVVRSLSREMPSEIRRLHPIDLTSPATSESAFERLRTSVLGRSALPGFPSPHVVKDLHLEANTNAAMARMIQYARQVYVHLWLRQRLGAVPTEVDDLAKRLLASAFPPEVRVQIDTIQRYAALLPLGNLDASHIQPGLHALASLSAWATEQFHVIHPPASAADPFQALWRGLTRRGGSGRPRLPQTPYELTDAGQRCAPLGAIYPGRNVLDQSPVDLILVPIAADRREAFDLQAEGGRGLGSHAPAEIESWGRFEWPEGDAWGFLALRRPDGVSIQMLAKRFHPLPEQLTMAIARQGMRSYGSVTGVFPSLARALTRPGNLVVDRAGVVRMGWDWARPEPDLLTTGIRKREEFLFCGDSAEGADRGSRAHAELLSAIRNLREVGPKSEVARAAFERAEHAETLEQMTSAFLASPQGPTADQECARIAVECHLGHQVLPAWLLEPPVVAPPPPAQLPARFRLRRQIDVACNAAWPLGGDHLLAWGRDHLMRIHRVDNGVETWCDSEPIHVRCAARGREGQWALGGWEGELRWFSDGALQGRANIGWTIGSIERHHDHWLAGSWNGRLVQLAEGAPAGLLNVPDGVLKITVDPLVAAVLGLRGSISFYLPNGMRQDFLVPPVDDARDVAFANGSLVVLTGAGLLIVDRQGRTGRPDRLPERESVRLVSRPADGGCLLVTHRGDSWRIDARGTYPRDITLPSGDISLMTSEHLQRCTAVSAGGGFAYWRSGSAVRTWPDARSAAISGNGRSIVVTLPETVELWEDEA